MSAAGGISVSISKTRDARNQGTYRARCRLGRAGSSLLRHRTPSAWREAIGAIRPPGYAHSFGRSGSLPLQHHCQVTPQPSYWMSTEHTGNDSTAQHAHPGPCSSTVPLCALTCEMMASLCVSFAERLTCFLTDNGRHHSPDCHCTSRRQDSFLPAQVHHPSPQLPAGVHFISKGDLQSAFAVCTRGVTAAHA